MSWFKKIFQSNISKAENKTENIKEEIPDYTLNISSKAYFSGLDKKFIDFIYFKNDSEKSKFISEIEELLKKLNINEQTDIVTGRKKITDYNFEIDKPLPFLDEIISYNTHTTKTISQKREKDSKVTFVTKNNETLNKLDNYYTALNLCTHNLVLKIENCFYDFKFEEETINNVLEKSELFNYARLSALFTLGTSFYSANKIESMEIVFNRVRKENYDLSPSAIAKFYRKIGEVYLKLKQNEKSLEWLKSGLILNPKLGVKKLIDKLEIEKK